MAPLLTRRQQIAARIGTEGGAFNNATLSAANANLIVYEPSMTYDQATFTREPVRATIGAIPGIMGQVYANLDFSMDVMGSGAAGTAPPWGRLLRACGFGETVNTGTASVGTVGRVPKFANGTNISPVITGTYTGTKSGYFLLELTTITTNTSAVLRHTFVPADGTASTFTTSTHTSASAETLAAGLSVAIANPTSGTTGWQVGDQWQFNVVSDQTVNVVYKTISDSIPVLDLACYQDGRLHKMSSARGNASFNAKVGEPARWSFAFQGIKAEDPSDASLLTSIPYPDVTPVAFIAVSSDLFGETQVCFTEFSFDMGNTLAPRQCANEVTGFESVRITKRQVTGSADPEAQLVADFDPWENLFTGATGSITFTVGSTSGNIVAFEFPNVQITAIGQSDRDGIMVDSLTLAMVEPDYDSGGDYSEVNITVS